MIKRASLIVLFIAIVISIFSGIDELQSEPIIDVSFSKHTADLTGFDFDKDMVNIGWQPEYYPNCLYTPQDFAAGDHDPSAWDDPDMHDTIQYGTYRFNVKLPAGRTYAATGGSNQFSIAGNVPVSTGGRQQ